jgi:phage gpG-like protein
VARVEVEFDGGAQLVAALRAQPARADAAGKRAVTKAAHLLEKNTKLQLSLSSHPAGTPTPSQPGEPPSLITGHLRRSVKVRGPARIASGWEALVGPTAVYGRVQEFGGRTGRGMRTSLPARPYVRPAVRTSREDIQRIFVAEFRR